MSHNVGFHPQQRFVDFSVQSKAFWSSASATPSKPSRQSHWRGHGPAWNTDEKWLSAPKIYMKLLDEYMSIRDIDMCYDRFFDWGVGGGANAVFFLQRFKELIGVDVSRSTLNECERQIRLAYRTSRLYKLYEIDNFNPEDMIRISPYVDLFLCVAVFQHFPYPMYAVRVLSVARNITHPHGVVMIQFRTPHGVSHKHRRFGSTTYLGNTARCCLFTYEEFEITAKLAGFDIDYVVAGFPEECGQMIVFLRRSKEVIHALDGT